MSTCIASMYSTMTVRTGSYLASFLTGWLLGGLDLCLLGKVVAFRRSSDIACDPITSLQSLRGRADAITYLQSLRGRADAIKTNTYLQSLRGRADAITSLQSLRGRADATTSLQSLRGRADAITYLQSLRGRADAIKTKYDRKKY